MPLRSLALASIALALSFALSCGGGFFGKQYEYEEDLYLSLDGSADIIINTSLAALKALRGIDVDPRLTEEDRRALRVLYESPVSTVKRIRRPWTRKGRRFVQIRVEVSDLRQLPKEGPLSWSRYELVDQGSHHVFRQIVGASALRPGTLKSVGWDGSEIVAFRVHLPSRIHYHNARDIQTNEISDVQRGNILAWEQHLSDRLAGQPVSIEVRMESDSVLRRTLWLFAAAFAAAVAVLVGGVWLMLRKGAKEAATTTT